MRTPYTDFMGAVYCAFAVNFLIFTKQAFTQICCLVCFSALCKTVFIECSAVYIVTEPNVN